MRRLLAVLLAVLFVACGDSPTDPGEQLPSGPLQMALVQGDGQEVAVTDTLPTDIVVRVTKGGTPLTDQLVDWKVLDTGCGEPFVTTTRTDSTGQTGNRIVAGTRAWTLPEVGVCEMEVRYALTVADTVQARVDTTVGFRVIPGPIQTTFGGVIFAGTGTDTISAGGDGYGTDEYGNIGEYWLEPDCCAHTTDSIPGSVGARTLVWDSAGQGLVTVMAGDSILDTAVLETDSFKEVRTDFRAH